MPRTSNRKNRNSTELLIKRFHPINKNHCEMSNRQDHGLKEHGLSDDAVEAGHDLIHDAEVEEERVGVQF